VEGLGDVELLQQLGSDFGLHPLVVEDIAHADQRPKLETYERGYFLVAQMLTAAEDIESEQVSMFLGGNFLLTFQEKPGDCFEPVRERIRHKKGQIRDMGNDYLMYALLDALVDSGFPVLDWIRDRIEELEDRVLEETEPDVMSEIHAMKRRLLGFRRSVWPLREVLNALMRDEADLLSERTGVYLRDCYDHLIRLADMNETYRELTGGLTELYLTRLSNDMNEVMKVLTIFGAIFIPLTFIAGVYGMNFRYMPELEVWWAYFACLGFMAAAGGGLLLFFRQRGWL
jgi:magnesium transporter